MTNIILKHRVHDAASDVFIALFKARSEALKRNVDVSLKSSGSSQTNWANGWEMPDPANSGVFLEKHEPLKRVAATLSGVALPAFPVYNSLGRIKNGTPVFVISGSNGGYSCSYTVTVDPSGRPYETSTGVLGSGQASGGGVPTC